MVFGELKVLTAAQYWEKTPVLLQRGATHHQELFEESDFVAVVEAFLQ